MGCQLGKIAEDHRNKYIDKNRGNCPDMIRKQMRFIFTSWKDTIFAVLIGVSTAVIVYLSYYQQHFFSKRYLFYSIIIGFSAAVFVGWANKRKISAYYLKLSKKLRIFSIVMSIVFALMILVNIQVPPVYSLIPKTDLQINIPIDTAHKGGQDVRLLWVKNLQGFVHFSQLQVEGIWQQDGKNLVFSPGQTVHIRWHGAVEPYIEVAFRQNTIDQAIEIKWMGNHSEFSLNDPQDPNIIYEEQLNGIYNIIVPLESDLLFPYYLPFIISFVFSVGYGIFSVLMILSNFPIKNPKIDPNPHRWLMYALPMTLVWVIALMVFWPGTLTNDGLGQWMQMASGNFNDWQSVIYSLLIFILTRVWNSPAAVALAQIISLAIVIAYGLRVFEEKGTNPMVLWCLSLLFAFSPINMIMTSIIWKDIPYATVLLWLTIILLQIYLSNGTWIKNWKHVIALSISAICVALFRKNGIVISIGVLILLIPIYFQEWKAFCASAGVFILLYLMVKGPLYSALQFSDESIGQSNLIFLHHIAAHVDAGTYLTGEESAYLESFLPLSEWDYWCYYVGPISYDPDFNRNEFLSSGRINSRLAKNLFLRDPLVDISHTFCASELVWRISNSHEYMKSTHGFYSWEHGRKGWVIANDLGFEEASFFPQLIGPLKGWLKGFGFADDFLVWYLRPALYLYLTLFSISIAYLRNMDWRIGVVGLPVFGQSAVLFLISFAPAFRYQYGTYLAGLFLLGFLFLPPKYMLVSDR